MPNHGTNVFSLTYVNDLVAAFIGALTDNETSSTYNITSHPKSSINRIANVAAKCLGERLNLCQVDSKFLQHNNVSEWTDLPLWLNCDFYTYDNNKMLRDMEINISDFDLSIQKTIDYFKTTRWKTPEYGMSAELRKSLVAKLPSLKKVY
ncbi:MAG: nucleoside-diphosphate-sugar epimerase [Bacteroidia bacterium]|jgi:nucleoside-diphosphate-sugar epimerase